MSISRQSIEELKKIAKISDFILESTTGKVRGEKGMAICPFHGEKTPSMSFTDNENLFHCFGCKEGGDIYKFVQEIKGLEFSDAVEEVASKYSFNLNYEKSSNFISKKELIEKANILAIYLHEELMASDSASKARAFLRGRGLEKEAIEKFKLGWIGNNEKSFTDFYKSKDISKKDLQLIGFYNTNGKQFFVNRVLFPIMDQRNNVIGFGGRIVQSNGPKYLNGPETILYQKSKSLYTVPNFSESAKKENTIYVFEGYIDVIAAHIYGINTAVAPCGTALTNEHLAYLSNFKSDIVLCFDNDEAGFEATKRVVNLNTRKEKALNVQALQFRKHKDIGDMLEEGVLEDFKNLIDTKKELVEFLFRREISNKLDQKMRKNEIVYSLSGLLNSLSPIEIDDTKKLIAVMLDLEMQVLEAELSGPSINTEEESKAITFSNEFETIFLSNLLNNGDKELDEVSNYILDDRTLGLKTKLFDLRQQDGLMGKESFPEYLAKYFTISYDQSEFEEAKTRLYDRVLDLKIAELSKKIELSKNKEESMEILKNLSDLKKKKESLFKINN